MRREPQGISSPALAQPAQQNPEIEAQPHLARNVILKGLLLFLLANLLFVWLYPLPALGRLSAYNRLFPGRLRLPYADNPDKAYSLSLFNLEAMLASHEIDAGPKPADEFRVILIGDSSTWGFLLPPGETLSEQINRKGISLPDGRKLRAYNLGYPVMSLTKDLLILSQARRYQPDLIVWPVTLESFPYDKQLFPPLLQNNPEKVKNLIDEFHLKLDPAGLLLEPPGFWDRTIVGARRALADLIRLQLFGPLWAGTGIDQEIPETYTPRQEDLSAEQAFHNLQPPRLRREDLALEVLSAGVELAHPVPLLVINEPMFISQGQNSDVRYNFFYPRWAYDDYRQILADESQANRWTYRDFWDAIPAAEFTNSAVHLSPQGSQMFADLVLQSILETIQKYPG